MATGTATLDFGAFPGASDASIAITGQAGIVAGSLVEAWIRPVATADHSADEHMLERIHIYARDIVAGVGFTIFGVYQGNDFVQDVQAPRGPRGQGNQTGNTPTIYGTWTVAWAWT